MRIIVSVFAYLSTAISILFYNMRMSENSRPRFKISRWIMLSLAILTNGFIIFYSCIDSATTVKMNKAFTDAYTYIINSITHKEVVNIPLTNITTRLSTTEEYVYNDIPGYEINEMPLGSAKEIRTDFYPVDATNKGVTYRAEPENSVILNQSGATVSVVGMKVGTTTITATSSDGNLLSSVDVEIVNVYRPPLFEISIDKTTIPMGETATINFDIDGGILGHNELINFRYYDTTSLTYTSSNYDVATIDDYGVIHPVSIGSVRITVTNLSVTRHVDIEVTAGNEPPIYDNLHISGSDVCYENDMILDQNTDKNHYQLTPMNGEEELNPLDFTWASSNELLVRVDKYGVMRGFRKSSLEEESATIIATNKATGQVTMKVVTVLNQLPNKLSITGTLGNKKYYNPTELAISEGDNIYFSVSLSPFTQNKNLDIQVSNPEVLSVVNEGSIFTVRALKSGYSDVTIVSEANPELTFTTHYEVIKAGAISTDELENVSYNIRKVMGHALVFAVAQIFVFITLYMFLSSKPWWLYGSISLGEGLFLACLSEFIQWLVPSRSGAFLDILIDLSGVVLGALLTFGVIMLIKYIKNKKKRDQN